MPRRPQRTRGDAPPPLANRDHLERANFALQASVFLQQLGVSSSPGASTSATASTSAFPAPLGKGKAKARVVEPEPTPGPDVDFARLARGEMRAFRKWTVHNLVKLDPSVKSSICGCNTVLVPGLTASVRVRPSATHGNVVHMTCTVCGARRSTPAAPSATCDLDGPVRAAKRARKMKRVPFHLREQVQDEGGGEVDDAVAGAGAGGKSNGKQGGKKAVGEASGRQGHILWRGGERLSGWGVCESDAPSHDASSQGPTSHDASHSHDPSSHGASHSHDAPTPAPAPAPVISPGSDLPKPDPQPKPDPKPKRRRTKAQSLTPNMRKAHSLTPEELEELANNG